MKAKFIILFLFLVTNILSIKILQKYSSIEVQCPQEKSIAFDSSGFNLNEEMFFVFKLKGRGLQKKIYYRFYDEVDEKEVYDLDENRDKVSTPTSSSEVKKMDEITSMTKYYTIKKDENRNFVVIDFTCSVGGTLTIENTKEDGGKKANTIIIIVVVVVVVVVIVVIVITCIKRKKARAAKAAMRMAMASGSYYPQPGMNMGMSVGVGMTPGYPGYPGYGNNYMMNNMPPQPNNISSKPVAYSRVGNDLTQIDPNSPNPNEIPPMTSGVRIKNKKV